MPTTTDLYRLGNASSPKMDNVRDNDIKSYTVDGVQWVRAGTGGISTFSDRPSGRNCWLLVSGSPIPVDLTVINDHGDHWSWAPRFDMTLDDYKNELNEAAKNFRPLENVKLSPKAARYAQTAWKEKFGAQAGSIDFTADLFDDEASRTLEAFKFLAEKLRRDMSSPGLSDDDYADMGNDLAFIRAIIDEISDQLAAS